MSRVAWVSLKSLVEVNQASISLVVYSKIDVSVCSLSQLPTPTKVLFFHELSYVKKSEPTFFVVIFFVICLTVTNLSGILVTTDTSFMQPWTPTLR